MNRRITLHRLALLALAAAGAGCAGLPVPRSYHVSTAQLEQALRARMPLRHSLAGIVDLKASVSRVRPLPELNRLATEVKFEASGPLLPQTWHGSFDLLYGLHFDPADYSLKARDFELRDLRLPMVIGRSAELLESAITGLARQLTHEVVLHRLNAREVERLRALELVPQPIDVTPNGLVIGFAPVAGA